MMVDDWGFATDNNDDQVLSFGIIRKTYIYLNVVMERDKHGVKELYEKFMSIIFMVILKAFRLKKRRRRKKNGWRDMTSFSPFVKKACGVV